MTVTWKTPGDGVQFIVTLSRDNASVYHHLSSFDGARYTYAQRLQPAAERSRSAHVSFYAPTTATDSSSKREITFDAIRLLYIYRQRFRRGFGYRRVHLLRLRDDV